MKERTKWLAGALLCLTLLFALPGTARASEGFADVEEDSVYLDAVAWAVETGITVGTAETTFSPDQPCTRGQVVTFLWRAKGRPAPHSEVSPFADVTAEDYFCQPVLWAAEQGIVLGTGEDTFSPNDICTGREIITILYRALYGLEDSRDGDSYYARALEWISTNDYAAGLPFALDTPCTRGMTAAFLYRDAGAPAWDITVWVDGAAQPGRYWNGQAFLVEEDGGLLPIAQAGCRWLADPARHQAFVSTVPPVDIAALAGKRIPVLMYHAVSDDVWGIEELFVSPDNLRAQLAYLRDNGYETLFFSDLAQIDAYEKPVLLTFDDGYRDNYEELFPLLREFEAKATIFSISDTFGAKLFLTPAQAREMSDSGLVEIQSHTANHARLNLQSCEEQTMQMVRSRLGIARVTKRIPYVLSYPNGAYDQTTRRIGPTYYDFGLRSSGGVWRPNGDSFAVARVRIGRETTIERFAQLLA